MTDTKAPFENVRGMAEMTLDKAREAVDLYFEQAERLYQKAETTTETAQAGTREAGRKAADYLKNNVQATFDYANRLVRAKDLGEVTALHQSFLKAQMEQAKAQLEEIGTKVASGATAFRPKD